MHSCTVVQYVNLPYLLNFLSHHKFAWKLIRLFCKTSSSSFPMATRLVQTIHWFRASNTDPLIKTESKKKKKKKKLPKFTKLRLSCFRNPPISAWRNHPTGHGPSKGARVLCLTFLVSPASGGYTSGTLELMRRNLFCSQKTVVFKCWTRWHPLQDIPSIFDVHKKRINVRRPIQVCGPVVFLHTIPIIKAKVFRHIYQWSTDPKFACSCRYQYQLPTRKSSQRFVYLWMFFQ